MVRVKRTYGMGRGLSSSREEPDRGRRWGGKQGGKGRGDEEWKSDERLRLRQGEQAAATRRASVGRAGGEGQRTVLQVEREERAVRQA